MAGTSAVVACVPLFRLGKETAGWKAPGERPVANFDEDSITMGVAATQDAGRPCLGLMHNLGLL